MEIEEISSKENMFLKRKELVLKVTGEGATPKKNELLDKLCSQYDLKDKNLVVIETIKTVFGKTECEAIIKIYESEEALKSIEPQPKKTKDNTPSDVPDNDGQMKVDLGDDKPAEKKEEAPAEKKEEPKPEEKPAEAPKEEEKNNVQTSKSDTGQVLKQEKSDKLQEE
jgi:ribosomal protein S24E